MWVRKNFARPKTYLRANGLFGAWNDALETKQISNACLGLGVDCKGEGFLEYTWKFWANVDGYARAMCTLEKCGGDREQNRDETFKRRREKTKEFRDKE